METKRDTIHGGWIQDQQIRHYIDSDTLLDWLSRYGHRSGFYPDVKPGNVDISFTSYIAERNREFLSRVLNSCAQRLPAGNPTLSILPAADAKQTLLVSKYAETKRAMMNSAPIIVHPVLHNEGHKTICAPQLLVRNDVLPLLIDRFVDAATSPAVFAQGFFYVVVLVRFTTLDFKGGSAKLCNTKTLKYYKHLATLQNQALAAVQGFYPPYAYIIGRGWKSRTARAHCHNALSTVGIIPTSSKRILNRLDNARHWLQHILPSATAARWKILPTPSSPYLYPNMKNSYDAPYTAAKKHIAEQLKEITLLWNCTVKHREECHRHSIFRLDDPRICVERLGITGPRKMKLLANLLLAHQKCVIARCQVSPELCVRIVPPAEVRRQGAQTRGASDLAEQGAQLRRSKRQRQNRSGPAQNPWQVIRMANRLPSILPQSIEGTRYQWRNKQAIEFYCDFETVSSINDPLASFPQVQDTTQIAMIGCAFFNPKHKVLEMKQFICERLRPDEECRIIEEWLRWMDDAKHKYAPEMPKDHRPRVWHWSNAERTFFESGYNSAVVRHGKEQEWSKRLNWCDLLQLFRTEPIVGPWYNFSLKSVAKGLYKLGHIAQVWPDSPVDQGLNAMVALFRCQQQATSQHVPMSSVPLMEELQRYLRIDVASLHSILCYLRKKH